MQDLPRRSFLLGGLAAGSVALVACGSSDDTASSDRYEDRPDNAPTGSEDLTFLTPTFPDGFRQAPILVAGVAQRFAFVVRDEIDFMRESAPDELEIRLTQGDAVLLETTVAKRGDGIITPYYPLAFTFDAPGDVTAELPGFPEVGFVPFVVTDAASVAIPQVGDPLPVVATPTFDDAKGIADICTRAVECPFHEIDLVDAAANDKPTVLLIATPGFCQTDICGPVVDLLMAEADAGAFNVIHAEVYVDPADFQTGGFPELAPVVEAMALPFEPALFVADADNTIVARLDTTFDRSELREALALV